MSFRCILTAVVCLAYFAGSGFASEGFRSPVDVALTRDGKWLLTANQTSGSVSLIDAATLVVRGEVSVGRHPVAIVPGSEPRDAWVTCRDSGNVVHLRVEGGTVTAVASFPVGYHPWGLAVSPLREAVYVAKRALGEVVELDSGTGRQKRSWHVGTWPERLALAPNERTLAVTIPGDKGLVWIDLESAELDRRTFRALNTGQPVFSNDSAEVIVPWMVYRALAIHADNIRRGWVWGSRIGRIAVDDATPRRVLTLDERGRAVADVSGAALARDRQQLLVTASGTHELLWFQLGQLPWRDYAATDHMDPRLIADRGRFRRIALGGRPMGVAVSADESRVFVANYLRDSVQVVSLGSFDVVKEIRLGEPTEPTLARRGAAIFYDAGRSLDQWYSCHTCHLDGGVNAVAIDTLNDGSARTFKTVLPLYHVTETAPWTWHGWQTDLRAAMTKSIVSTMLGSPPTESEIDAMIAYLRELKLPENPYLADPDVDAAAVERGRELFNSDTANCRECHQGSDFTDGLIHDVGTGTSSDKYDGFNTPTLRGLYLRRRYLHDGRAATLEDLLKTHHSPDAVSGTRPLTDEEIHDLTVYLRTL